MQVPFILITYGFSRKLFSYEEEGVHKLPIFGEAILAHTFIESIIEKMSELLEDKEELQVQICSKAEHAIDIFKLVSALNPTTIIIYNAAPMVDDPQEAISRIAKQLKSQATVINREYDLETWSELLENQSDDSSLDSELSESP